MRICVRKIRLHPGEHVSRLHQPFARSWSPPSFMHFVPERQDDGVHQPTELMSVHDDDGPCAMCVYPNVFRRWRVVRYAARLGASDEERGGTAPRRQDQSCLWAEWSGRHGSHHGESVRWMQRYEWQVCVRRVPGVET